MIKVTVTSTASNKTIAFSEFKTQGEADVWIEKNKSINAWGKPERWVEESRLIKEGEDAKNAIETAFMDNPYPGPGEPKQFTIYKFAGDYSVASSEVTIDPLEASKESIEALSYGAELIACVRTLNKSKLLAGTMTLAQFNALLADPLSVNIERALWTGSFNTAKQLMALLTGYYTSDEMAKFNAKIDLFLAKYP